jgi:lactoylglutathione lyase
MHLKIEHLAIWTTHLESIRSFYLDHFGCSSSSRYINPTTGFSSYFITLPSGGARLELMTRPDVSQLNESEPRCGYAHLAISLGSEERVRTLTETLRQKGVAVKSEPRRTGDGYYESVITDPDGNLIELTV